MFILSVSAEDIHNTILGIVNANPIVRQYKVAASVELCSHSKCVYIWYEYMYTALPAKHRAVGGVTSLRGSHSSLLIGNQ